jgi:hypothetical protein
MLELRPPVEMMPARRVTVAHRMTVCAGVVTAHAEDLAAALADAGAL